MGTSPATRRPAKKQAVSREEGIAAFWRFSSPRQSLTDSERLQQIKVGFPADLIQALRLAFDLQDRLWKRCSTHPFRRLKDGGESKRTLILLHPSVCTELLRSVI